MFFSNLTRLTNNFSALLLQPLNYYDSEIDSRENPDFPVKSHFMLMLLNTLLGLRWLLCFSHFQIVSDRKQNITSQIIAVDSLCLFQKNKLDNKGQNQGW